MKEPVHFSFGHLPKLLGQAGLDRRPPEPVVLGEEFVEQPALLQDDNRVTSLAIGPKSIITCVVRLRTLGNGPFTLSKPSPFSHKPNTFCSSEAALL